MKPSTARILLSAHRRRRRDRRHADRQGGAIRARDSDYQISDVDEAIERANSLEVGLGGSVWGDDVNVAATYAARLECGTAWVNQHGGLHPLAPFGGVKYSGIGVEFNVDGLKEYTTIQVMNVAK